MELRPIYLRSGCWKQEMPQWSCHLATTSCGAIIAALLHLGSIFVGVFRMRNCNIWQPHILPSCQLENHSPLVALDCSLNAAPKLNKQSTNCFGCPGLWKAKMDLVDQQMFGFEKGVELSYTGRFPHQKHQQKWQAKTPESTLGFLGAEDRRDLLWELLWRGLGGL